MTAMPLPGVTWSVRHEIGSALILHPLGESQQDPYIIVGGLRAIGRAEWQTNTSINQSVKDTAQLDSKRISACLDRLTKPRQGKKIEVERHGGRSILHLNN